MFAGGHTTPHRACVAEACAQKPQEQGQRSHDALTAAHALSTLYPTARAAPPAGLQARHFVNLTNGVEALPELLELDVRFTRLQSSHCESGAYDRILGELDTELLMALACGRSCYVYDFASRNKARGVPRAVFLGLEFVRWSLGWLWFREAADRVMVRGKNVVPFWRDTVMPYRIDKVTKKKLRYYAPFAMEMGVREVALHGVYGRASVIDGCKGVHVKMVRRWLEEEERKGRTRDSGDVLDDDVAAWFAAHGLMVYDSENSDEDLVATQRALTLHRLPHEQSR